MGNIIRGKRREPRHKRKSTFILQRTQECMRTMNTRIRDLVAYLDTYLKRYDRDKLIGSKQMKVTKHARGKLREISGIDVYTSSDVCKMGASLKKKKKKKKSKNVI
mgnify:CR=1 FL=1